MPVIVLSIYLAASLISFAVYAFDKSAARRQARRTPEKWLHLLSVCGGWPGALVAQQVFRHKTKKTSFRVVFYLTVVINLGLLWWLARPGRGALLGSITG